MNPEYIERREWPPYLKNRWGINYSVKTFGKMATTGGGPQYVILGNKALAKPAWLDQWVQSKLSAPRTSTSDAA